MAESANDTARTKRVCIIGAGFAGIAAVRALTRNGGSCDVTVFEKNPDVGGVWYFAENEGLKGKPGYIYKGLRTNSPIQSFEFHDLPHLDDVQTWLTPMDVKLYLDRYVDTFSLKKFIQFKTEVKLVEKTDGGEWVVTVTSNDNQQSHKFDYVILCNGIRREQFIPDFPGLEEFQGSKIHSGDFKSVDDYAGKSVLIVGTGMSMYDICLMVAETAKKVVISGRAPHHLPLPNNCSDRPLVTSFTKHTAKFEDGTEAEFDDIIFCTAFGDFTKIPFLDPSCGLSKKNHYVYPLYNNMINATHPTMMVLGYFEYTFLLPCYEFMADYFEAIVTEKTTLPSQQAMLEDIENEFKIFAEGNNAPHKYVHINDIRQKRLHQKVSDEAGLKPPNKFVYEVYDYLMKQIFDERKFDSYREESYRETPSGDLEVIKPE